VPSTEQSQPDLAHRAGHLATPQHPAPVLERTAAAVLAPASNLRAPVAGAAWTYLLETLHLGRVLCLGVPAPGTLSTLARLADRVTLVCSGRSAQGRAARYVASEQLGNVALVEPDDEILVEDRFALVVMTSSLRSMSAAVQAAVENAGVLYVDGPTPPALHGLVTPEPHQPLYVAPATGEVHGAAPLGDEDLQELARAAADTTAAEARPGVKRVVRRAVSRVPVGAREVSVYGVPAGPPA
jgi:hypothetical protein